jgi:hypothetical protein
MNGGLFGIFHEARSQTLKTRYGLDKNTRFSLFARFEEMDRELQILQRSFVQAKPQCNVTDIDDCNQGTLKYIYE